MKKQAFNPYLPEGEYIPDGEPHVFGDRIYVYGSHDAPHGLRYCPGDYVVWSAPIDDLSNWTNAGVTYKRNGKFNRFGLRCMWAPDCVYANGKYYLYYCYDFDNRILVAVSDYPDRDFAYLGTVHHADGTPYGKGEKDIMCFDPGVFRDDDGEVYLYSGYSANEGLRKMLNGRGIKNVDGTGNQGVRLEDDMLTVKGDPFPVIPGYKNSKGTGFEGHEMYEASSMRKFNGKYYFIYSSRLSHELAYAISDYPDHGFKFGGALHSNGNIGLDGREQKDATYYWGNNHGSIEKIGEKYYIFCHRQTNRTEQSRQGCAEEIFMDENGMFHQVEMTSCGLNGKPLEGNGTYPAYIACHLTSKNGAIKCAYGPLSIFQYKEYPFIGEKDKKQSVKNLTDGCTVGYKYFDFSGKTKISVETKGEKGSFEIRTEESGKLLGTLDLSVGSTEIDFAKGKAGLFFTYCGKGKVELISFTLETR